MSDQLSSEEREVVEEFVRRERAPHLEPEVRITGLMIQYYHVCQRELWFMHRGIDIDRSSVNIVRGTRVDEESYDGRRKSILLNQRIAIDMLESGDVVEIKVSSSLDTPPRMQLLYYLWYLDRVLDIEREGVLAFPTERSRERVTLTDDTRRAVEAAIFGIIDVVSSDTPPKLEKKPYCDSCQYQDLCWV